MTNNKRKEGWYWVVVKVNAKYKPIYFNGFLWEVGNFRVNDSRFYYINETRITTPDASSVLDKAIELISNLQINNDSKEQLFSSVICILEQLKSENK